MQLNLCFSCVESPEMSTPLSKSRRFSSFQNIDEEAKAVEKQGIVTILGSDCERTKAASLRRTLSADMSSKKWLAQNGFSPMKKIASSERISASLADSSSSSEGEEDYEERKEKLEGREQFDMWSSILSQKANEDASTPLPPPYIHPLVKRSASSLNEKSLEICTESLGSETGSDGFSSYPSSETGEEEEEEEEEEQQQLQEDLKMIMCSESFDGEELRVAKYNNHYANSCKKSEAKSFPPPLPSLSREDGASLRMQSRRDNGRLVLEAVSVPSQNRFRAQRHDGRLVLTLVDSATLSNEVAEDEEEEEEQEELGDFEEVYDDDDEDEDEEDEREEEDEEDEEMEQAPTFSSRVINVHRLALMMNKPIGIAGRNPTWPRKFNEVVKFQDDETEPELEPELTQVTKSLPPRPRVARLMPSKPAASSTASVNSYEYYWRAKPTQNPAAAVKNNTNNLIISKNIAAANDQNRGNKGDYFLPLSKGCKEPRRSLLFWEPYCIATS
jgi:hypothetical protein